MTEPASWRTFLSDVGKSPWAYRVVKVLTRDASAGSVEVCLIVEHRPASSAPRLFCCYMGVVSNTVALAAPFDIANVTEAPVDGKVSRCFEDCQGCKHEYVSASLPHIVEMRRVG